MNLNMIIDYLQILFSIIITDKFGFWFFEILFFSCFLRAVWKDKIWPERSVVSAVLRGKKTRKIILAFASAFTTFVISTIFTVTSYPKDGRVLLYLVNLGMIVYLFFYSGWFTNKLVGLWVKFEQRNFNPHGQ